MSPLPAHPDALNVFKGMNSRRLEGILTQDKDGLVQLLKSCSLLPTKRACPNCGKDCKVVKRDCFFGYMFECPDRKGCRKRVAATDCSFFANAKLSPDMILRFAYYFARGEYKYEKIMHELRRDDGSTLSPSTISDYVSFLREVCACAIDENPEQIGGPGTIVEIDETCMVKYKHHRGQRLAKPTWVFGGVERGDPSKFFCVIVDKRDKATLEPLISKHIAPKSTIISDGWAAYCSISNLPGEYTHQVVNHSKFFKDPDTGAHTNSIEGAWMLLKAPQKAAHGRHRNALEPSLFEHCFRRRFREEDVFYALLVFITKIYDVNELTKDQATALVPSIVDGEEEKEPEAEESKEEEDEEPSCSVPKRARETSPELFFDSD